jgi:hypothetical protein
VHYINKPRPVFLYPVVRRSLPQYRVLTTPQHCRRLVKEQIKPLSEHDTAPVALTISRLARSHLVLLAVFLSLLAIVFSFSRRHIPPILFWRAVSATEAWGLAKLHGARTRTTHPDCKQARRPRNAEVRQRNFPPSTRPRGRTCSIIQLR